MRKNLSSTGGKCRKELSAILRSINIKMRNVVKMNTFLCKLSLSGLVRMVRRRGSGIKQIDAIALFVDIRGFTKWSENIDVFQHSPELVKGFYQDIMSTFKRYTFKPLGDGGLLVKHVNEKGLSRKELNKHFMEILSDIKVVEKLFSKRCEDFLIQRGHTTDLKLGWGISRGRINKLNNRDLPDYIGSTINKASRLCSLARPFGIVIDKDDFAVIPKKAPYEFHEQQRRIPGIDKPICVWVTNEIFDEFLTRETMREQPEVHVAGFCYKINKGELEFLIAKRSEERRLYPGKYEGCGGQLKYSEAFDEGVKRHYLKEMKIEIEVIKDVYSIYTISQPNEPIIPGICFFCAHVKGEPKSPNHSIIKWVKKEELEAMPEDEFIPGVKSEFLTLINHFEKKDKIDW